MSYITHLKPVESVYVDQDRINMLYAQLGQAGAEDVVCRAMEELAVRLANCDRYYQDAKILELRKSVRSLIAIAEQIGMCAVSSVSRDVIECIDKNNHIALAATFGRLMRVGEEALSAIWDLQDITI